MTATEQVPVATRAAGTLDAVKIYGQGTTEVRALDGVTVSFQTARFTAIMGPSGSGKSTLLHCVAGLDTLSSGQAFIGDTDLSELDDKALTILRREQVGFVFQAYNLVPTLTAYENIRLPLVLGGRQGDAEWIDRVIETVGLRTGSTTGRASCRVGSSSGWPWPGPRRAGRRSSSPTSRRATSTRAGGEILDFMRLAVHELGQTIVMVTHDPGPRVTRSASCSSPMGASSTRCTNRPPERVLDRLKRFGADVLKTALRNVFAHKLRLLTTGLAVMLGVAFTTGTLVFTDTMGKTFDDLFASVYENTDAVVRAEAAFEDPSGFGDQRGRVDASLVDAVATVDGVASARGNTTGYAQIVDKDGEPLGNPEFGAPVFGGNWDEDEATNPFTIAAGRARPRTARR